MTDKNVSNNNDKTWLRDAFLMLSRLSIWVAMPVIFASFLGKYLDEKFGTRPWIVTAFIIIAFNVSIVVLIWETNKVFKDVEKKK